MNKIIFSLLIATFTLSAFATDEGVFDVRVRSRGGSGDGFAMASGWVCTNSTSVGYQEYLANHRGERKYYDRLIKEKSKNSIFSDNNDVELELRKDMSISSQVSTRITESCSKTTNEWKDEKVCDKDGLNCKEERVLTPVTQDMTFNWDCTFNKFPQQEGKTLTSVCSPSSSGFGSSTTDALLVRLMKSKDIRADMTLKKRYESFAINLCGKGSDLSKRKIIKLTQGLDSLLLENDFVVKIKIDGVTEVELKNKDGVLNDEIAICRDGSIQMTVTAVEEDPIYDDIYSCKSGSNTVHLNANSWGDNSATIDFKRDNFWDKMFLDDVQQIRLEIRNSPITK